MYSYRLWRTWDESKPLVAFIMLNPSTDDETEDDPTIRRCIGYADDWGFGSLIVGNLFALRATDPQELYQHPRTGRSTKRRAPCRARRREQRSDSRSVGRPRRPPRPRERGAEIIISPLYAHDTTKEGQPVHPLYQPATITPEE